MIEVIAFDYGGVIKINDSDLIADICEYLNISKDDWHQEYFKINHLANTQGGPDPKICTPILYNY